MNWYLLYKKYASKDGFVVVISGPPASGKTTIMNQIKAKHPDIIVEDMDNLDNGAYKQLEQIVKSGREVTVEDKMNVRNAIQNGVNQFLSSHNGEKIVLVGIAFIDVDVPVLDIAANYKFLIDVDPSELLRRKKNRDKNSAFALKQEDEKNFYSVMQLAIQQYQQAGYQKADTQTILNKIDELVA